MTEILRYQPKQDSVAMKFHSSNAFVRGLMGPVGSGKSTTCIMEIMARGQSQKPHNGVRKTRWAIIRNTYPELKSTTIKTFQEWVPDAVIKWDAPISCRYVGGLNDGTSLDTEIFFFPVDRPEEIGKLKSLELTGAWINEAAEIAKGVFDMVTQRVGRFPPRRMGGPSWSGVLLDTNPPDDDHWYYRMAERGPKEWDFFKQPGGLTEVNGDYVPNLSAENIGNLPGGHEYYLRQIHGKTKDWIKVFLLGQYGSVVQGKPVYPEWSDDMHCKPTAVNRELPLLLGFDYGLTPAVAICQVSRGRLHVIDELFAIDMGISQFARDIVIPHLAVNYPRMSFQAVGDPAGSSRAQTDEKSCFMELAEAGLPCVPASTNAFAGRREAVAKYLTKMVDAKPGLLVDPKCDMIRRGFNGRYCYKRVQVSGDERYRDVPDKNDYSHLHDALQYAALYSSTMNNSTEWSKPLPYPAKTGIV